MIRPKRGERLSEPRAPASGCLRRRSHQVAVGGALWSSPLRLPHRQDPLGIPRRRSAAVVPVQHAERLRTFAAVLFARGVLQEELPFRSKAILARAVALIRPARPLQVLRTDDPDGLSHGRTPHAIDHRNSNRTLSRVNEVHPNSATDLVRLKSVAPGFMPGGRGSGLRQFRAGDKPRRYGYSERLPCSCLAASKAHVLLAETEVRRYTCTLASRRWRAQVRSAKDAHHGRHHRRGQRRLYAPTLPRHPHGAGTGGHPLRHARHLPPQPRQGRRAVQERRPPEPPSRDDLRNA